MAYHNAKNWKPTGRSAEILGRAMDYIQSVPYQVSARWVFYRLLQDGIYNQKSDYRTFIGLTSRARHSGLWAPDLLADETRDMVIARSAGEAPAPDIPMLIADGILDAEDEKKYLRERLENYYWHFEFQVDPNFFNPYVVVIIFEARAMLQQFSTYTDGLTLCPFGGQPSIPFKYRIAKYIETLVERYRKDAVVLYFGDLDDAGLTIWKTGAEDIQKWCRYEIHFERCGLTEAQVAEYRVPENFEHPGYQWEALDDTAAASVITMATRKYTNPEAVDLARREALRVMSAVEAGVNV